LKRAEGGDMHTPCKPLSVGTVGHAIPRSLVDGVIEPMCGFKLLLKVFTIRIWGRIIREIKLSKSPVRRIRNKAAEGRT